jgi:hypothetical protein
VKKFMLLGALVAVVVAALAIPALAQQDDFFRGDQGDFEDRFEARQEFFEDYFDNLEDFYGVSFEDFEDEFFAAAPFEEEAFFGEDAFFEEDLFEDDGYVGNGIGQSFQQEAESGDVSQSFNVSGGGDNSNQCVGIQGVANTGNAQNQVGVIQYGSAADDFSFEDSGASITVSPNSFTSCDQRVNQSATASG